MSQNVTKMRVLLLAMVVVLLAGCTATPEVTVLPPGPTATATATAAPTTTATATAAPTETATATATTEFSPLPTPTGEFSPLATPTLVDFVPLPRPMVSVERHFEISASDVVTFALDVMCDGSVMFDPEVIPPEDFVGILEYELYLMYALKYDGERVDRGEVSTGLGPFLGDAPCEGVFAKLYLAFDRYDYGFNLYQVWIHGQWKAPEKYGLPVVWFVPGPDEVVDELGYSLWGSFWGLAGQQRVYLPIAFGGRGGISAEGGHGRWETRGGVATE